MSLLFPPPMDALPGYTPVRRRPQSPFGHPSPAHAQMPWTTARCNRLLRPIASRILLLRKSNNTKPTVPISDNTISQSPPGPVGKSRKTVASQDGSPTRCRTAAQMGAKGDPDWVPSPVMRRRVKHKYSSRTTGNKVVRKHCEEERIVPCSLPGEVTIATPIITQKTRPYTIAPEGVRNVIAQDHDQDSGDYAAEGRKRRKLQSCPSRRGEGDPVPHDMRQNLKKVIAPARWMLIDGLYNGLDALLKGTEKSTRPQSCGARSLFSLCLRRVPDYITAEQAWHESQDDDDDVDVCSEVYSVLENMSSASREGWKPLREVARAHGVAMLSAAIREGLIDHVVGRGLVFLCIHALAFDEAETLLDSLVSSLDAASRPLSVYSKLFDSDSTACLGTLDVFASRSGRHGFQYRQLEKLLDARILPVEWVATTEFAPTWGRVVQSISHGDQDYGDAARLLITAVMLACGPADQSTSSLTQKLRLSWHRGQGVSVAGSAVLFGDRLARTTEADAGLSSALNNTISSLMAIMYAISITQRDKGPQERAFGLPDSNDTAFALLGSLNLQSLQRLELSSNTSGKDNTSTIHRRRAVTVFLAILLLLQEGLDHQNSFLEPGLARIPDNIAALGVLCEHNVREATSQVANVVAAIARCCAKASPGQEFSHLKKLTHHLESIAGDKTASTGSRQLFACFASTTAMEYGQQTGNTLHVEWALEVEERVRKDSRAFAKTLAKTPQGGDGNSPRGYRWEEGICEWIAKTPSIKCVDYRALLEQFGVSNKAPHQHSSRQRHREAPSAERPFGISTQLSKASGNGPEAPSKPSSNRPAIIFAPQLSARTATTTQHAKTAGHAFHVRQYRPKKRRDRSLRKDLPEAGPHCSWEWHADHHEDELSTSDAVGERVPSTGWKVGIAALGSACRSHGRGSRPALRSAKCQPSRFRQGPRPPVGVASLALEEGSEDELGM